MIVEKDMIVTDGAYELDNGLVMAYARSSNIGDKCRWWNICIPEESNLWNKPSRQLIKALNNAKKLIPYAKELQKIERELMFFWGTDRVPVTDRNVKEVECLLTELKNVENNPFADEDAKELVRDILEQYAQRQRKKQKHALRQRKKGLQRTATSSIRQKIILRDKSTCQYCGKKLEKKQIHIDHKIPYALGGRTELDNLVVACSECNLRKSGFTLQQVNMTLITA